MEYFNITLKNPKFGYSKGEYFFNKENSCIYKGIGSIKGINSNIGNELYELSKNNYDSFISLLIDMKSKITINSRQIETLIKLDYFSQFGRSQKLLDIYKYYQLLQGKKSPKKNTVAKNITDERIFPILEKNSDSTATAYKNINIQNTLDDIWDILKNKDVNFKDKLSFENEVLGYINYKNTELDKRYALITSLNNKYTPVVETYCLNNGATAKFKISKKLFKTQPCEENTFIYIHKAEKKIGWKKIGEDSKGKPLFEQDENKIEWWITEYSIIEDMESVING